MSDLNFSKTNWLYPTQHLLPTDIGIGLKPEHFEEILQSLPDLGFFEIHAENYMVDGGPLHFYLSKIREHYPLSIHGVGLSIGGQAPVDEAHLDRLTLLLNRYQPELFSEHLAWSTHQGHYMNDLLPVPYTQHSLTHICEQIDHVQTRLGRRMLLENPATYVEFDNSDMTEEAFITEIINTTGCGLLIDINNVYVSCINHHRDPLGYIQALPLAAVGEIHLAGFATDTDSDGSPLLIDSHDSEVAAPVWNLYQKAFQLMGPRPTLLERDGNLPGLTVLHEEAKQAKALMIQAEPQLTRQHA